MQLAHGSDTTTPRSSNPYLMAGTGSSSLSPWLVSRYPSTTTMTIFASSSCIYPAPHPALAPRCCAPRPWESIPDAIAHLCFKAAECFAGESCGVPIGNDRGSLLWLPHIIRRERRWGREELYWRGIHLIFLGHHVTDRRHRSYCKHFRVYKFNLVGVIWVKNWISPHSIKHTLVIKYHVRW